MSSSDIRERVDRARAIQHRRGSYNAHMPFRVLRELCELGAAGQRTLEMAARRLGFSTRAHDRILEVGRDRGPGPKPQV